MTERVILPLVISALTYPRSWPIWENVRLMLKHQRSSLAKPAWLIMCIILPNQVNMALLEGYLQSTHLWISTGVSLLPSIMSRMKSCKNLMKTHCFTTCDTSYDILRLCCTECYKILLPFYPGNRHWFQAEETPWDAQSVYCSPCSIKICILYSRTSSP